MVCHQHTTHWTNLLQYCMGFVPLPCGPVQWGLHVSDTDQHTHPSNNSSSSSSSSREVLVRGPLLFPLAILSAMYLL